MKSSKLHKTFSGNRAFLVGNGTTLTPDILDRLHEAGEFSFGLNKIAPMFEQTIWRPTFFVAVTTAWAEPEYRPHLELAAQDAMLTFHAREGRNTRPRSVKLNTRFRSPDPDSHEVSWWSDNISEWVSVFGTSMLAAEQIAAYMGFDPLILVGVDGQYTGKNDHYIDGYRDQRMTEEQKDRANRDHRRAHVIGRKNLKRLGVTIVDASGGPLDVYPKVDLDDYLA